MIDEMTCCPNCGSNEGYFTKEYAAGKIVVYHSFPGGPEADNGEMYDHLDHRYRSKYAFCMNCKKKLFKVED